MSPACFPPPPPLFLDPTLASLGAFVCMLFCLYQASSHQGSPWLLCPRPARQRIAPKLTPHGSGHQRQLPSYVNILGRALNGLASITCTPRPIICSRRGHWAETWLPWHPGSSGVGGLRGGVIAGEGGCVMNRNLPALPLCSVFSTLGRWAALNLLGTAPFICPVKGCFSQKRDNI